MKPGSMTIGEASRASGVSAKMLRYYETIGLMPKAGRTEAGYRLYSEADVNTLRFIHRARAFGFPLERVRQLVALWHGHRASRDVKQMALRQVGELDQRITELTAMRDALQELADSCHGDNRPDCPILRDLAGSEASCHAHPAA